MIDRPLIRRDYNECPDCGRFSDKRFEGCIYCGTASPDRAYRGKSD